MAGQIKNMSNEDFKKLWSSKDMDKQFEAMDVEDQQDFLLRAIAQGSPKLADLSVGELREIVEGMDDVRKKGMQSVYLYCQPSLIKKYATDYAYAYFGPYLQTEELKVFYFEEEAGNDEPQLEDDKINAAVKKVNAITAQLQEQREPNPKQKEDAKPEKAWGRNNFQFTKWFPDKNEFRSKLDGTGFAFFRDEAAARDMFRTWLLGKKGFSLQKVADPRLTTDEEKAALGAEFLEDISSHPVFGFMEKGQEEVQENLKWYGEMYATAMYQIFREDIHFPPKKAYTEEEYIKLADTKFGFAARIAKGIYSQLQETWLNADNQTSWANNYGINMQKSFLDGYGEARYFYEDVDNLKALAAFEENRGELEKLSAKPTEAKEVRAYLLLQGIEMNMRLDEDSLQDKNLSGEQIMLRFRTGMETARTLSKDMDKEGKKANICQRILKNGTGKVKQEESKFLIDQLELDFRQQGELLRKNAFQQVTDALTTINDNHNEEVYDVSVNQGEEAGTEMWNFSLTKEQINECVQVYDRIFKSLELAEQYAMKQLQLANEKKPAQKQQLIMPDDYMWNFKLDGKSLMQLVNEQFPPREYPDMSLEERKEMGKVYVVHYMIDSDHRLEYRPSVKDPETDKLHVKEPIQIAMPFRTVHIGYDKMDEMQRSMQDLIVGYGTVKKIDAWYHHNSNEYEAVRDEMKILSSMLKRAAVRDEKGKIQLQPRDWEKLGKQFEKTAKVMETYEQRRAGTTNSISAKRLRAIAPLKKMILRNAEIYAEQNKSKEKKAQNTGVVKHNEARKL